MKKQIISALAIIAMAAAALCSCSKESKGEKSIPAEKITVNKEEIKVLLGQSVSYEYSISPAETTDKVTFSSDNPQVATIDANGTITATSDGVANIEIKCGKASATFKLMVFSNSFIYDGHRYPITSSHLELSLDNVDPRYSNNLALTLYYYKDNDENGPYDAYVEIEYNYDEYNGKSFDLTKNDPLWDDDNYDGWYYLLEFDEYEGTFERDDADVYWPESSLCKSGTSYAYYNMEANDMTVMIDCVDMLGKTFKVSYYEASMVNREIDLPK